MERIEKEKAVTWLQDTGKQVGSDVARLGKELSKLYAKQATNVMKQTAHVSKQMGEQAAHVSKQVGKEAANVSKQAGKKAANVSQQVSKQAALVSKQAEQASKQLSKQAALVGKQAAQASKQMSKQAANAAQQVAKTAEHTALAAQKTVKQTQRNIARRTHKATKRLPFTLTVLLVFGVLWWLSRKPKQEQSTGRMAASGEGSGLQPQGWQERESAQRARHTSLASPANTAIQAATTPAAATTNTMSGEANMPMGGVAEPLPEPPVSEPDDLLRVEDALDRSGVAHAPNETQLATDEYVPPAVPASTITDVFGGTPRNMRAETDMEIVAPSDSLSSGEMAGDTDTVGATSDLEREHIDETTDDLDLPQSSRATAKRDDLTIIEGIGRKVAQLMEQNGISTFAQLADTNVERLREILRDEGLQMLDPKTWPEQARLAAENRQDQLEALKENLKAGRRE